MSAVAQCAQAADIALADVEDKKNVIKAIAAVAGLFKEQLNGCDIRVREYDGYISATDICKAADNKELSNYLKSDHAKTFEKELKSRPSFEGLDLVQVVKNVAPKNRGTWAHPLIALHVAHWASPKMALEMSQWYMKYAMADLSAVHDIIKRHNLIHESRTHLIAASGADGDVAMIAKTFDAKDKKAMTVSMEMYDSVLKQ